MVNHNRAALNRLYRKIEDERKADWIVEHLHEEDAIPLEDPYAAALRRFNEDTEIAERRAAYPLH